MGGGGVSDRVYGENDAWVGHSQPLGARAVNFGEWVSYLDSLFGHIEGFQPRSRLDFDDAATILMARAWRSFGYPTFRLPHGLAEDLAETSNDLPVESVGWPFPAFFLQLPGAGPDAFVGSFTNEGGGWAAVVIVPKNRIAPEGCFDLVSGCPNRSVNDFSDIILEPVAPTSLVRLALNLPFYFATQPVPSARPGRMKVGAPRAPKLDVLQHVITYRDVRPPRSANEPRGTGRKGRSPRRHVVRGHVRRLPEGIVWVRPHFRGARVQA